MTVLIVVKSPAEGIGGAAGGKGEYCMGGGGPDGGGVGYRGTARGW